MATSEFRLVLLEREALDPLAQARGFSLGQVARQIEGDLQTVSQAEAMDDAGSGRFGLWEHGLTLLDTGIGRRDGSHRAAKAVSLLQRRFTSHRIGELCAGYATSVVALCINVEGPEQALIELENF